LYPHLYPERLVVSEEQIIILSVQNIVHCPSLAQFSASHTNKVYSQQRQDCCPPDCSPPGRQVQEPMKEDSGDSHVVDWIWLSVVSGFPVNLKPLAMLSGGDGREQTLSRRVIENRGTAGSFAPWSLNKYDQDGLVHREASGSWELSRRSTQRFGDRLGECQSGECCSFSTVRPPAMDATRRWSCREKGKNE